MRRAAIAACFLMACTSAPPPQPVGSSLVRVHDETVRAAVTADAVTLTVVVTLTNRTRDTLHIHPCSQQPPFPPVVALEREDSGVWQRVWSPACTMALMLQPPRLAPGESRVDTARISGPRGPNAFGALPDPIAGTYRVVYGDVYRRWYADQTPANIPPGATPLGERVADSLVVSNVFRIVQ